MQKMLYNRFVRTQQKQITVSKRWQQYLMELSLRCKISVKSMHLVNAHQPKKEECQQCFSYRVTHFYWTVKSSKHGLFLFLKKFVIRFLLYCVHLKISAK